jgi:dCTP deaminase
MILTGQEIIKNTKDGKIKIDPFHEGCATTNSYDLKLGTNYIRYTSEILDPKTESQFISSLIPPEGLTLDKGDFILASSEEKVGSDHFVPLIHAKSGIARLGLFVHVTADLIDIGSYGNVTFQLYATLPVTIYPGMAIAQATFWVPKGEIKLYDGKYQGSDGPQPSRIHMDKT